MHTFLRFVAILMCLAFCVVAITQWIQSPWTASPPIILLVFSLVAAVLFLLKKLLSNDAA